MTSPSPLSLTSREDISNSETRLTIIKSLDAWSSKMAKDLDSRINIEKNLSSELWGPLEMLWKTITESCMDQDHPTQDDLDLLSSITKFTRNLVAGVSKHQVEACKRLEPYIQKLIHYFTSFLQGQRAEVLPVTRLLAQALSNIITDNEEVASSMWKEYMAISHDGNILLRLLTLEDVKTTMISFILMLNATKGSSQRCSLFTESKAGQRIAIKVLVHLANLMDAPEETIEATTCDIGYQFLKESFDCGLGVALYHNTSQIEEPIAAHQSTLLKLLDGYFQQPGIVFHAGYSQSIPQLYSSLLSKTSDSINTFLAKDSASMEPDLHLPALAEGLSLVAQCIQALLLNESASDDLQKRDMLREIKLHKVDEVGLIEATVWTLRDLDILVPRIQFGKSVPSPLARAANVANEGPDPTEFPFVKRDLVRLLGTLAYRDREVQDRVRQCGGIEVILNHCVIDERNPYLREHAIFAIRNLLEGNEENQKVVQGIRPLRDFDSEGVLRNLPPQI